MCNHALRALLFATLYVCGAELGHLLSFPEYFATFWPPSGIFLVALLRTPNRQWPAVVLLALICNLVSDVGLHNCTATLSVGFWSVNAAEAITGAWLLRRLFSSSINCDSLREVLAVLLVAGVLNTMVGATLGALLITQAFAGETYSSVWHMWWVSDLLGVVVFAPVALTLTAPSKRWHSEYSTNRTREGVFALLCLATTSQLVYGPGQHPLAFLVFPILIWIALRFDIRMICIANVGRCIVGIWNTEQGTGPFATAGTVADQVLQLQVFLCLTSGSFLVLAVVVMERHRAARVLQESEARYRDLLENIDDLVHSVNSEGNILYTNRAWRETLGYSQDDLQSLSIFTVIHPGDHVKYRQKLQRLMKGENLGQNELRFITSAGRTLVVEGSSSCRFVDGQPTATRSIFRDITDRREHESQLDTYRQRLEDANRQLKLLATTDALTGLQNRRAFQERLVEEVERAQRYGHPVSLLLLDVDHFKQFNDSFGHLVGDEVLKQVSRILEATARTSDYLARFGGEEFAIILPNTDSRGAMILAERFREAIAAEPFPDRRITVSLGVATLSRESHGLTDIIDGLTLIKGADEALYFSKHNGRNQVHLAGELHHAMA
ncbi:MAG: domain S-box-containing protein/diguanylate cyclase protein [Planctomycetaceae bacterium]|nr:domain S-box-containing protein/diguanylate cyclase protein [Planctomycetaceae bacterium]